jgi:hypothetical protein
MGEQSTRGKGPSGDAKIHNVQHSSKKDAREAAQQNGKGEPVHHPTSDSSGHYHSSDSSGKKAESGQQGGVHHNYGKK